MGGSGGNLTQRELKCYDSNEMRLPPVFVEIGILIALEIWFIILLAYLNSNKN